MRNHVSAFTIGTLLFACISYVWAGDGEALAIVNKAIQAAGGEKNLAKHNAVTFKEKGTYYGMGEGLPYTGNYAIQWPNQFRMEIEGVFTIVVNGDKGWQAGMGEVKELTKEQLDTQRHDHRAGWMTTLLPLKDKAFTLKSLKDDKVGKHEARVVLASRKNYPDVKLYFDKTSNLLIKMEYRSKAAEMNFKEVTMDTIYSDFKDVDGAKVAHKMVMHRDGKVFLESEVLSMKAEGKLDAKVFAMPK
jgi:hypothetical protein